MLKFARVALLSTTMLWPAHAHAGPLIGFIAGLVTQVGLTGIGGALFSLAPGAFGAFAAGFGVSAFLSSGLGSLLLSVGLSAAQYLLNQQRAPKVDAARINTRVAEGERWVIGGRVRSGGQAAFGEYDASGNFWYIVIHSDTEAALATGGRPYRTYLDDVAVEIDENHRVITAEFTKQQKEGGDPVFSVWTTTYSPADPTPPPIAAFKAAFPAWTDDHRLVGTTYSVIKCDALKQEDRYKVMRWRGPFGLGEPAMSIVDDWDRQYDPRDPGQNIDDRATWKPSGNLALIWAWWRTHRLGRAKSMSSIAWDKIAEQADICDQIVLDKNGDGHKRYECGIAVADSKPRGDAEQEILLCGDGVILYDDAGKAYVKVGAWEESTLTLSRNRDILAMASRTAQDGEMQSDGVVVRYIESEFGWIAQPSAPWKNPRYFQEGRQPRYLTVDILGCHDHNQALRLAKAIGETSQAPYRLAPTTGLRGLKAKGERLVNLAYDDIWNGPHKIATTVEEDEVGLSVSFGIVPVGEHHWTLLEGEEGDKPAPVVAIEYDDSLPLPTGVTVYGAPVPGSGGASVRLEATFDASPRVDWRYEFQYRQVGDLVWRPMLVLMDDLIAYSDTVPDGETFEVQFRTVTTSGRASDWKDPPITVVAIADTTPPLALAAFAAAASGPYLGGFAATVTTQSDTHLGALAFYRVASGGTLDTNDSSQFVARIYRPPAGATLSVEIGDPKANLFSNGDFAGGATGWTNGGGTWTFSGGEVSHSGAAGLCRQFPTIDNGADYNWSVEVTSMTTPAFNFYVGATGIDAVMPPSIGTAGLKYGTLTATGVSNSQAGLQALTSSAFSVTFASLYKKTAACQPQGAWDYYAVPENASSVDGPASGPLSITIV